MSHFNLLAVLLLSFACASKPSLYPNQKLKEVGTKSAEKDVDHCMAESEKYLKSSKGKKIAKSAGAGAMIGGAMGVVSGMFTGNMGSGLVRGGAIGAAGGGTVGAISPDELKHRYVNQCLADKGYQVIGWD